MLNRIRMFSIIYLIGCLAGCATKQENTELKHLFDLNWKFRQGDISSAIEVDYNDTLWRNLDLPHDWSIEGKLNQLDSDKYLFNVGWYRKKFNLPSEWKNKSVTINFEGVKSEIKVYLNENLLARNPGTSDSFQFDLTPHLNYTNKNIIAVRINSSQPKDGKWLKGTGIPNHVWLFVADSPDSN